jgi:hypothetical protein
MYTQEKVANANRAKADSVVPTHVQIREHTVTLPKEIDNLQTARSTIPRQPGPQIKVRERTVSPYQRLSTVKPKW